MPAKIAYYFKNVFFALVFSIFFLSFSFSSTKAAGEVCTNFTTSSQQYSTGQAIIIHLDGCPPDTLLNYNITPPSDSTNIIGEGTLSVGSDGVFNGNLPAISTAGTYLIKIRNGFIVESGPTITISGQETTYKCGEKMPSKDSKCVDTGCSAVDNAGYWWCTEPLLSCQSEVSANQKYRCPLTQGSTCDAKYSDTYKKYFCGDPPPNFTPSPDPTKICGTDLYNDRLTFCSLIQVFNNGTVPYTGCGAGQQCFIGDVFGEQQCGVGNDDQGNLLLCFNAPTKQALDSSTITFTYNYPLNKTTQTANGPWSTFTEEPKNNFWTCVGGQLSEEFKNGTEIVSADIQGQVTRGGNVICTRQMTIRCDSVGTCKTEGNQPGAPSPGTTVGTQPGGGPLNKFTVSTCGPNNKGVKTAIGCIPTDITGLATFFFALGLGLAGGIAFLLIIFGGLRILLSNGDPEALNEGKEIVTSAIVGLLLIIFSIFILKIIGVDIFALPGFYGASALPSSGPI